MAEPSLGNSRRGNAGKGRQAGSKNKITATLTQAIDEAFGELGGADYLIKIGRDDPKAFCALLGRRLPKDMTLNANGSLTITVVTGVPGG